MAHQPPIPPEQLSDKVFGEHSAPDRKAEVKRNPAAGAHDVNTKEQGDAGNLRQNVSTVRPHGDR